MEDPPIANLHNDLLWQIFSINAVHGLYRIRPESSPLTTARHTSQVCASWRQLIISSPSLWGNIIDLPFLQQKSDAWRNEVLLRTGNSELLIFGHICGDGRKYAKNFLELLLENHWTRIQQVNVGFEGFYGAEWPDNAWSALGRPAPNLRFFSVTFDQGLLPSRILPRFTLFDNHAPLLTHFQQSRIPMNIEEASWISSLISLTLDLASNLTVPQVLEACSQMRSLQTLHLEFRYEGPSLEGLLHYVNIPSLSTLFIDCPLDALLAFLEHIKPAPGCVLQLLTQGRNLKWKIPTEFVVFQRIVAKFADNYFCHRNPSKSFHLIFTDAAIEVGDVRGFIVAIRHFNTIPPSFLVLLLGAFVPYISGVKTLHLCGNLSPLALTNFFAPMTSLEWLSVTTASLIYFINLMDGVNEQHSFPRLKTLKWLAQLDIINLSHISTSLIVNFLTTRRNLGLPIEIFDFTDWDAITDAPMDVQALEGIPGLKVVWRDDGLKEYICGSGRPQELYAMSSFERDIMNSRQDTNIVTNRIRRMRQQR